MEEGTAIIMGKVAEGEYVMEAEMVFHLEASQRVIDSIDSGDKTAPPTYTDPLVTGKFWNKDSLDSLREVAYGDPLGNAITVGMAENSLLDGWRYVEEIGDVEEVDAAKTIHEDFEQIHANYWFTQSLIAERIFGDSLLYKGEKPISHDIIKDDENATALDVFTPEYYEVVEEKRDKMGRATEIKVMPNPTDKKTFRIVDYDDFIHILTRPIGRSDKGYSALYSSWSYVTLIRHACYNLGWAMQKFGTGALIIFLSGRLTPDTEASLKLMLKNASQQRAGIADSNLVDRIEYIGPEGSFSNNIPESINMFTGFVSAASRIPTPILMGQSPGSSGGEIPDKTYYANISKIQQSMVKYIKALAKDRGHPIDWKVDFNATFAKDARQAAEIRHLEALADDIEASAELKRKQAERGEISVNFNTPEGFKDTDKTQNDAKVQ